MPKKLILDNTDFHVLELSTPDVDRYVVTHKSTGKKAYGVTAEECYTDLLDELTDFYRMKVIKKP